MTEPLSAAADRLETLAVMQNAQEIWSRPDPERRERDATLLRNVAALVRACEVLHQSEFGELLPRTIRQALTKLQEDGK